jgi:protocatechuate 3,4-dioxygenase beta subunit
VAWTTFLLPLVAFAGAGNIDAYVYDLKTGAEVRAYTARLVGTGGYDRTITVGNTSYVRFANVPTDQIYTLTVSKADYIDRSIPQIIPSHANTRTFNLGLTPASGVQLVNISGVVVDALTNAPLRNAYVEAYRVASGSTSRRVYAMTGPTGRFTLSNCVPGTYVIWAWRVGYYQSPNLEIQVSDLLNDAVIPCAPHDAVVTITNWRLNQFYDALSGDELRAGECVMQSEAGWTMRFNFWRSQQIDRLPANQRYTITVRYNNTDRTYYPSTRVGFLFTGDTTEYTSHYLIPGDVQTGSLSGVVRNMLNGAPVEGALVQIRYGTRPLQSMYTDSQGRYAFSNLPRDTRELIVDVSKPGWRSYSWRMPPLTASGNTNDLFTCPNNTPVGDLRLYVYDEPTGSYIGNSVLQINFPGGRSMRVDLPDGNYDEIAGLPAWQLYDLIATAPGYRSVTYLAQWVPYNSERAVSFNLLRATQSVGRIFGTVRDMRTGDPIPNAVVSAYSITRADSMGRYSLTEQPIGSYNLTVSAPGYNTRTVQVQVSSGDTMLDFALVPAEYPVGRVYGYVRDVTTGDEIPNSTAVAVAPNGWTVTYATGPSSGYYNFPELPSDMPFTFIGSAAGYNSAQVINFWPQQGGTTQIDLRLTPSWGGLRMQTTHKGTVHLSGYEGDLSRVWLTVEVYQHGALIWRQDVRLNPDGSYEISCPVSETADLRLKADRWISQWLPAVALDTVQELPEVRFTQIGDVNDDDQIDDADLMTILYQFGMKEPNAPDLNGDGYVDDGDLLLVLLHFGAQGR